MIDSKIYGCTKHKRDWTNREKNDYFQRQEPIEIARRRQLTVVPSEKLSYSCPVLRVYICPGRRFDRRLGGRHQNTWNDVTFSSNIDVASIDRGIAVDEISRLGLEIVPKDV